jgi:hypothetical protein
MESLGPSIGASAMAGRPSVTAAAEAPANVCRRDTGDLAGTLGFMMPPSPLDCRSCAALRRQPQPGFLIATGTPHHRGYVRHPMTAPATGDRGSTLYFQLNARSRGSTQKLWIARSREPRTIDSPRGGSNAIEPPHFRGVTAKHINRLDHGPTVLATRSPNPLPPLGYRLRRAERRNFGAVYHEPPRITWPSLQDPVVHAEPSAGAPW